MLSLPIKLAEHKDEVNRMQEISEIQQEWTAKPFVKIDSFEGSCPEGWEPVFERVWNGLDKGCLYDYT